MITKPHFLSGSVTVVVAFLLTLGAARAATRVWDGGGANGFWSNPTNWAGDVAPGAGDGLSFPIGAARVNNTNDLAGLTVATIQFATNGYTLNGNTIAVTSGVVASNLNGGNFVNLDLSFDGAQFIGYYGVGGLILNGTVTIASNLTVLGSGNGSGGILFGGSISGSGGLVVQHTGSTLLNAVNAYTGTTEVQAGELSIGYSSSLGATGAGTTVRSGAVLTVSAQINVLEPLVLEGRLNNSDDANTWSGPITLSGPNAEIWVNAGMLTLSGAISGASGFTVHNFDALRLTGTNSYSGDTRLVEGPLIVDGLQPFSRIVLAGGTLTGIGRVGPIVESLGGGTIAPGASPGLLTSSNLVLGPGTTVAIEINGNSPGTGYDQLNVVGTVSLGNAHLSLNNRFAAPAGASFVIITNDASDAVSGTFLGLPEGALITNGPAVFRISYAGGSGNDVVLTVPCAPSAPVNLRIGQLGPQPQRVFIQWNAVVPGCSSGLKGYVLYRDGFEVGRNTSPGVVDALMIAGHTYTYRAAAITLNGEVSLLSTGFVVSALPPNPIVGTQKVVNLLARFSDYPDTPFGTDYVNTVMFNGPSSVRAYYEENSYGKFSLAGTSYGWLTLPNTASNYCNLFLPGNVEGYDCDITRIRSDVLALLPVAISNEVAGADIVQILVHGMGTVGLSAGGGYKYYSATNGFSHGTVIHEISHGLNSLLHSGSWELCDVYTVGPDLENLTSGGCNVFRYGDQFDPLGGGSTFHHNMWFKEMLGWIGPSNISTITTNGEYRLSRVEIATNAPQVLKFDLGNEMFYFFEYRTPIGMDGPTSPGLNGVTPVDRVLGRLRVSRPPGTDCETLWLPRCFNGPRAFLDPYRGLLVELIDKTNGVARLRVTTNYQHTFRVTDFRRTGTGNRDVSLIWNSVPGVNHFVEGSTNLTNWQVLSPSVFAATISTTNVISNAGTNRFRFFRVGQYPGP